MSIFEMVYKVNERVITHYTSIRKGILKI